MVSKQESHEEKTPVAIAIEEMGNQSSRDYLVKVVPEVIHVNPLTIETKLGTMNGEELRRLAESFLKLKNKLIEIERLKDPLVDDFMKEWNF